jgi:amino acid adenylation domain-containing protein
LGKRGDHSILPKSEPNIAMFIHHLIQQQCLKHPDQIAVEYDGQKTTYRQLARSASLFAARLSSLGVTNETLCGLCLPPSLDAITAMLGILQANAAFVPIDPALPQERVSFLVKDAQLQYTVCSKETQSLLPRQLHIIYPEGSHAIEENVEALAHSPEELDSACTIERLAYVIYTSGSTGVPKGVMIEHHGLCDLIEAERLAFDLQLTDRVLQFASLSFDVSVYEIFTTLLSGATLCIPTIEAKRPGPALLQFLQEEKITVATLLPPVLASLKNQGLPKLRTIITGGEPCPQHIVDDWAMGRRFFNAYGPTEATIGATIYECKPYQEVCIGRALPHVSICLLDEEKRQVVNGERGEIYIGGTGVGRGYLFDPVKTRERFIESPFGEGRLYKTGDLGRLRPDGNLEFLGRLDEQIKHNGFRIELGEIEHTLLQHEKVLEAAVVFEGELVAFYLGEVTTVELTTFLGQRLPQYMIPRRFVLLKSPQLTPNSKWDKAALRALASSAPAPTTVSAPAKDPLEARIAALFAEVLSRPSFSIDDNFFEQGGDSLLAAKLLFRLQEERAEEKIIKAFFEEPTPRAVASLLTRVDLSKIEEEVALLAQQAQAFPAHEPRPHVILTGATGYLGAFLLQELQRRGEVVVCLIRGESPEDAKQKLHRNVARYHLEIAIEEVQVVRYDLAVPSPIPAEFLYPQKLYHCAANVDLLRPYTALKQENLYGTASLLSICAEKTQFHYVSTLSTNEPSGGYAQSKWAAEQLIKSTMLNCSITRPSMIAGHSKKNQLNPNDFFYALLRESLQQKQFPVLGLFFDLIFVDQAAQQICEVTAGEHFIQSASVLSSSEIADALQRRAKELRLVPYSSWRKAARGEETQSHLAYLDFLALRSSAARPLRSKEAQTASSQEVLDKYLEVFLKETKTCEDQPAVTSSQEPA